MFENIPYKIAAPYFLCWIYGWQQVKSRFDSPEINCNKRPKHGCVMYESNRYNLIIKRKPISYMGMFGYGTYHSALICGLNSQTQGPFK